MIGTKPYAKLKYREVKGRQMAYIDEGDAIVFQHGQPASSCVWRNVMPHLEGRCRLIACDLIGMGRSEKLSPSRPTALRWSEKVRTTLGFFVFAVGCLIAAWAVLGSGMAVGLLLKRLNQAQAIRYAGWAMIGVAALIAIFPGLNDVIIHFLE